MLDLPQIVLKEKILKIHATMIKALGIFGICTVLTSCAGRDADPVRRLTNADR